jgi:hypothetical protein
MNGFFEAMNILWKAFYQVNIVFKWSEHISNQRTYFLIRWNEFGAWTIFLNHEHFLNHRKLFKILLNIFLKHPNVYETYGIVSRKYENIL